MIENYHSPELISCKSISKAINNPYTDAKRVNVFFGLGHLLLIVLLVKMTSVSI